MILHHLRKGYIVFRRYRSRFNIKMTDNHNQSGLPLQSVIKCLKEFAPLSLSETWDNTGVLIEPYTPRLITKILLTNDLTENVMEEAVEKNTELIISYHPPIFSALKSITQKTWKQRIVSRCLEERIALYSPHTSWDSVMGGVNDWLAECLPEHSKQPISEGRIPGLGPGRICDLVKPTPLEIIIQSLKLHIGIDRVQLALAKGASLATEIKSVALCAGSGSSLLRSIRADLYLTGEMSHHDVLDAIHNGASVILTNHSNSERGFLSKFAPKLEEMLNKQVQIMISTNDCDPLKPI
ncbi:NIF3-like protein 1 [Arctopsyche grandis]|uniref:NIF3-like protein 1 n=1 Tax=Arctopsyche grandis TaxID=121162 RepID=UPI00406D98C8